MKKLVAFALFAMFVSACSQYTCPTYMSAPAPTQEEVEQPA